MNVINLKGWYMKYQLYRTKQAVPALTSASVNRRQGFTLIELLIVIVIIGILVTIGIFAFQSSQKKSRDSRRKADLNQVSKALEMYNNDQNKYPGVDASGQIAGCGAAYTDTCPWGSLFGYTSGATNVIYMIKLPKDPTSTWYYTYEQVGKGYRLYARLENLQDSSFPASGPIEYDKTCGTGVQCNYVITSPNVVEPTPKP